LLSFLRASRYGPHFTRPIMRACVSISVVAAAFLGCCRIPEAPGGAVVATHPAWTTELNGDQSSARSAGAFTLNRQIAFGSEAELVVASDSGSFAKPNKVHAWLLDTGNGSVVRETDWISGSWPYLFATAKGEYAVVTEEGIALYSDGLRQIKATAEDSPDKSSPDGRFLAVSKTIPGHGMVYLLDSSTLKPTAAKFLDTYAFSVAQDRIAYVAWVNGNKNASVMQMTPSQRFPSYYQTACPEVRPHFASRDTLAILGCGQVEVISYAGASLFSVRVEGASAYFVSASRNGSRFAVLQQFYRPGDPPALCCERVTVFDIARKRAVFVADIIDSKGDARWAGSGVALSPDGSKLAIRSGNTVRLFLLPQT
jgi:hypothetical protein